MSLSTNDQDEATGGSRVHEYSAPTDDRGAAALAERLRMLPFYNADQYAAAILGERGRFLPDGYDETALEAHANLCAELELANVELARLRQIEAAARDVMACGGRFYHGPDCPEDAALRAALESEIP